MIASEGTPATRRFPWAWGLAGILAACELATLWMVYDKGFSFVCRDALPDAYCAFAGYAVPRALGVLAILTVYCLARPEILRPLAPNGQQNVGLGIVLNLAGFLSILAPFFWVSDDSSAAAVYIAALGWSAGGFLAALGLALMIAPFVAWRSFVSSSWLTLLVLVLAGLAIPEAFYKLLKLAYPIWRTDIVTEVTFAAVVELLQVIGYSGESNPTIKMIAADDFAVLVGPQCSGVEGFLLITLFLTVYLALFRKDLRFPHALLLYPLGLCLSWAFNVLRIVVLLVIGAEVSPDLAIGGFHSHAGWLTFTALSIILIVLSRFVPFFMARGQGQVRSVPPLLTDPVAGRILPFAIFMLSALVVSAFAAMPGVYYPLRILPAAIAVILFWRVYAALDWRIAPISYAVGLGIGLMWVLVPVESGGTPPYGALAGGMLVFWLVVRGIGTVAVVPIIEELFFRDYLEGLLRVGTAHYWTVFASLVSAGAFAALHDRWIEAFIAGLAFSFVRYRSGRISDAIVAHAVANAFVFVAAIATGNLHII